MQRILRVRDRGFSFIELLAYMAIAALLILAAVPQYSAFRLRADISNTQSDLRNAASAMEAAVADDGTYPSALPSSVQASRGVNLRVAPGADGGAAKLAAFLAACKTTNRYQCYLSDGERDLAYYGAVGTTNGVSRLHKGDLLIVNSEKLSAGFRAGGQFIASDVVSRQIVLTAANLSDGWFLPTADGADVAPIYCLNAAPTRAPKTVWSYSPKIGVQEGTC